MKGNEDCLAIWEDGTLNDADCAHLFSFICMEVRENIQSLGLAEGIGIGIGICVGVAILVLAVVLVFKLRCKTRSPTRSQVESGNCHDKENQTHANAVDHNMIGTKAGDVNLAEFTESVYEYEDVVIQQEQNAVYDNDNDEGLYTEILD
ncbi:uncharacterized protein LOC131949934 [Physella acuta]|uniref:uncharacterized protein LOC131949934 n=1 Tax=Physella acuta TaxID=109671 RepID=UPI0027DD9BD7|nr:uncharacterized protein LOC131949934 [Physella acuta]